MVFKAKPINIERLEIIFVVSLGPNVSANHTRLSFKSAISDGVSDRIPSSSFFRMQSSLCLLIGKNLLFAFRILCAPLFIFPVMVNVLPIILSSVFFIAHLALV